jgi:hypothetical protein
MTEAETKVKKSERKKMYWGGGIFTGILVGMGGTWAYESSQQKKKYNDLQNKVAALMVAIQQSQDNSGAGSSQFPAQSSPIAAH